MNIKWQRSGEMVVINCLNDNLFFKARQYYLLSSKVRKTKKIESDTEKYSSFRHQTVYGRHVRIVEGHLLNQLYQIIVLNWLVIKISYIKPSVLLKWLILWCFCASHWLSTIQMSEMALFSETAASLLSKPLAREEHFQAPPPAVLSSFCSVCAPHYLNLLLRQWKRLCQSQNFSLIAPYPCQ